mmetsp:Transcript_23025/g.58388  ORF Transcript_23025/g.58388 Transcript_23025/m.58388 type:complete len:258 (-) Transcript_23025:172-945(-)
MEVVLVPVLEDNYAYLLVDQASRTAFAVDPAEPKKVMAAAEERGVVVKGILTTHKHWDHAGGNDEYANAVKGMAVYGGVNDNVEGVTEPVKENDSISLGGISIKVYDTPCHTKGHVFYFATHAQAEHPVVFTGDTLFVCGCGKFFEGCAEMMHKALMQTASSLPDDTRVYCGHEYTAKNIQFAVSVDKHNEKLKALQTRVAELRREGKPTVPSTIKQEKECNPFMRVDTEEIAKAVGGSSDVDTMHKLRQAKDGFRG